MAAYRAAMASCAADAGLPPAKSAQPGAAAPLELGSRWVQAGAGAAWSPRIKVLQTHQLAGRDDTAHVLQLQQA